jgi:hypothetical protein
MTKKKKQVETVQAGPSNWQETLPILLVLLEASTPQARKTAREELRRMAIAADIGVKRTDELTKRGRK